MFVSETGHHHQELHILMSSQEAPHPHMQCVLYEWRDDLIHHDQHALWYWFEWLALVPLSPTTHHEYSREFRILIAFAFGSHASSERLVVVMGWKGSESINTAKGVPNMETCMWASVITWSVITTNCQDRTSVPRNSHFQYSHALIYYLLKFEYNCD